MQPQRERIDLAEEEEPTGGQSASVGAVPPAQSPTPLKAATRTPVTRIVGFFSSEEFAQFFTNKLCGELSSSRASLATVFFLQSRLDPLEPGVGVEVFQNFSFGLVRPGYN